MLEGWREEEREVQRDGYWLIGVWESRSDSSVIFALLSFSSRLNCSETRELPGSRSHLGFASASALTLTHSLAENIKFLISGTMNEFVQF